MSTSADYLAQFAHIWVKVTSSASLRRHLARRRTILFAPSDLIVSRPSLVRTSEILFMNLRVFKTNDSFFTNKSNQIIRILYTKLTIAFFTICTENSTNPVVCQICKRTSISLFFIWAQ